MAHDVHFTREDGALYAMTLGKRGSDQLAPASLKRRQVERVEVVGTTDPLKFSMDRAGLHVSPPQEARHDFGIALKIAGAGLAGWVRTTYQADKLAFPAFP